MLLPFCVAGYAIAVPQCREWLVMQLSSRNAGSGWLCSCRPTIQGVAGYAVAVPRYREWLVMQLPSHDAGSSAGRAPAQIGT